MRDVMAYMLQRALYPHRPPTIILGHVDNACFERGIDSRPARVAGYLTGLLPALFGANATYATIQALEAFVDQHYSQQIARMDSECLFPAVREILNQCRLDEVSHRDEARDLLKEQPSVMLRLWCAMVGRGSSYAVALARIF